MLSTLRRSQTLNPEALSFSSDLQRAAARRLVWGIVGMALAVWLVLGITDMQLLSGKYFALGAAMALCAFLALKLADRPSLIAQILWQTGLAALLTVATGLYPRSFIRFYYMLLPFVAAVTISAQAAVLAEAGAGEQVLSASQAIPRANPHYARMADRMNPQMPAWHAAGAQAIYDFHPAIAIPPRLVTLHDITVRDGEECASLAFSVEDKVRIAEALARLGVKRMELFLTVPGWLEAIRAILGQNLGMDLYVTWQPGPVESAGAGRAAHHSMVRKVGAHGGCSGSWHLSGWLAG